ncbi:MAG: nitroreductase [Vicingaceae bacterium]|jgi:nitroreductase
MQIETLTNFIINRQSLFSNQMEEGASIEKDLIWSLLKLANYAPSHRRTQPWRFRVFHEESKNIFFTDLANLYKETTNIELYDENKYKKIANKSSSISTVIAICMKRCSKESVPVFEEEYAVACAVQNILLGMKPLGIIGYWSTPKMAFTSEMKAYLELDKEDKCMGFLQLGLPKQGLPEIPQKQNDPIELKVTWH